MATTQNDRPTAHTEVTSVLQRYEHAHAGVRKTLEYLRGERHRGDLSMQQDVVPALKIANGVVALRYEYKQKTEHVWPAAGDHDTVSSCHFDPDHAFTTNVPMSRDELAIFREIPDPDGFVHEDSVAQPKPQGALPESTRGGR